MAQESSQDGASGRSAGRRFGCWTLVALLLLLLMAAMTAWFKRVEIADDLLTDMLDDYGVQHSYVIEHIGPRQQVLTNIVIGDPNRPDLTIERAEITIRPSFGLAAIGSVRLVRPRLFGAYRDGQLSFGQLDPLVFGGEQLPFEFPDYDLTVEDGRALMVTDFGPVGIKLAGKGYLRGGFEGEIAAVAPSLKLADCTVQDASLYGRLTINAERPGLAGPLRLGSLSCPEHSISAGSTMIALDLRGDRDLAGVDGTGELAAAELSLGSAMLSGIGGEMRLAFRDGGLTAQYDLAGEGLASGPVAISRVAASGALRMRDGFERIELESKIEGQQIVPGAAFDRTLAELAEAGRATLIAPLVGQIRSRLAREGRGSELTAELTMRSSSDSFGLVMPAASLRGGSGATLLSLSRFQIGNRTGEDLHISGNFVTGGEGLPRIVGRMEGGSADGATLRLTMAPYVADDASLAIPNFIAVRRGNGAIGFSGQVLASGPLPGGEAQGLRLPISGNFSPAGTLSVWRQCTEVTFERLQLANLTLGRQGLTLCPPRGGPILLQDAGGLRIAAGVPSLELAGTLGESPISISSGPIGLAWPGVLSARDLSIKLGPPDAAARFVISDLEAQVGDQVAGTFSGVEVRLYGMPLDVNSASGNWRYENGQLALSEAAFELADQVAPRRFEPMVSRDAVLSLQDGRISAQAVLREPQSDREVAVVDIAHDLTAGTGHADLKIEELRFDKLLQPAQLTPMALGVVANVRGSVAGSGRIDWNEEEIVSHGVFASDGLDLAAEFGAVEGLRGTITFIDLLGMTTAPDQRLYLAAINPGIEIYKGEISYQVTGGEVLELNSGKWPFLGGMLTMRPSSMRFGASEVRRYVFDIDGLDAALFVDRMELNNLSATGIFDGTIPITFDTDGNGSLEGGALLSRSPGGNVSYVGGLTYEDLTPIANFAFDALRSLDYRQMEVLLDGSLTGEIVTRVRFEGVKQGDGASSNIITRQLAKLPLRFVVNIRAPFYSLITSVRALYDPSAIRDPREIGLIDDQGNAILDETGAQPVPATTATLPADEASIQPPESETVP